MAQFSPSWLLIPYPHTLNFSPKFHHTIISNTLSSPKFRTQYATSDPTGAGPGGGSRNGGNGSPGGGGHRSGNNETPGPKPLVFAIFGPLINGWRSRVLADPQFPFKVLMEELVGLSACLLGDMASRPKFGLDELDFVFSTLVVGSILNFALMYILAPTASGPAQTLPAFFSSCPPSNMFEPGPYNSAARLGTFVFKGLVFGAVGLAAGFVGTAISNGLIAVRRRVDPGFEPPNEPPPTVLNAATWAVQLGVSSNLRYQTLNGVEYLLAKRLPPVVFRASVVVLRCLNNVVGGMSFVALARLTGSQAVEGKKGKNRKKDE